MNCTHTQLKVFNPEVFCRYLIVQTTCVSQICLDTDSPQNMRHLPTWSSAGHRGLYIRKGKWSVVQPHWRFLVIKPQGIRNPSWVPACHPLYSQVGGEPLTQVHEAISWMGGPAHEIVAAYFDNSSPQKHIIANIIFYYGFYMDYNTMHLNSAGLFQLWVTTSSRGANCRQAGCGI